MCNFPGDRCFQAAWEREIESAHRCRNEQIRRGSFEGLQKGKIWLTLATKGEEHWIRGVLGFDPNLVQKFGVALSSVTEIAGNYVNRTYSIQVKTRSVTGLAHAVEKKSKLVLDMIIQPATIFISEGGTYNESKPIVLADLGELTIATVEVCFINIGFRFTVELH